MKTAIKKILAFILIVVVLFSTASCGFGEKNESRTLTVAGIDFSLPKYMKRAVSGDGVCYTNKDDGTRFCVLNVTPAEVESSLTDTSTAEDYMNIFVLANRIEESDVEYDAKKQKATVTYTDVKEGRYHCELVLKSGDVFHHVEMDCKSELADKYKNEFKDWAKTVKANNDKFKSYTESGLKFALPEYMKKLSVTYADICYGNITDNAQFYVYFYSKDSLLTELYLSKDATVKEYADWFVDVNNYVNVSESYDEKAKKIVLKYIYDDENTYYCDFIMRNDSALFHVTLSCDADMRNKYEPIFGEWMSNISLVY